MLCERQLPKFYLRIQLQRSWWSNLPIRLLSIPSSHQLFFWNSTFTRLSHFRFSSALMRKPLPRKITNGLTPDTPCVKIVSWTVHCRFSSPDEPLAHQISFDPVWLWVLPSSITKGSRVWSIFAMSARLNVPLRRSRSNFPWNISMTFFSSAGDFFARC